MSDLLSFLSGGIVGGFLGAFLGGFAKFFWELWLPDWLTWRRQQRVQREKVLSQFRGPAIRAISELEGRMSAILSDLAGNYGYVRDLGQGDYYINSTAFLIAQYFAWDEILRQEVGMLDYSDLVGRLEQVTSAFSHGFAGFQVFRLRQREIGEQMLIEPEEHGAQCMGYSGFVKLMGSAHIPAAFQRLDESVRFLLESPGEEIIRLILIQHALIDLIGFIDPEARWVPDERRAKVDAASKLEQLLGWSLIDEEQYHSAWDSAEEIGLIAERALDRAAQGPEAVESQPRGAEE
jgi:hypothetical protein